MDQFLALLASPTAWVAVIVVGGMLSAVVTGLLNALLGMETPIW